jgi:hypothetical protein
MSFMDKVKAQAEQAMVKGQQAVAQGQGKLNDMQANKSNDGLLRDLGSAYYAQQRSGGSADAVEAALGALDAHAAAAAAAAAAAPPTAPGAPDAGPPPPAAGGSFGLDDI